MKKFRAYSPETGMIDCSKRDIKLVFENGSWHIYDTSSKHPVQKYLLGSDTPGAVLMESTGLTDKNGKESFSDDIWEIKGYEFKWQSDGGWLKTEVIDLRFIIVQSLWPSIKYKVIQGHPRLKSVAMNTIFNHPVKSGRRIFVDKNRQELEIIGNIHENPKLLTK